MNTMKILITGSAGFIGFHISQLLAKKKKNLIIGIDNLDNYYDVQLKKKRLRILNSNQNFKFYKKDITNKKSISLLFKKYKFTHVIHLAAQAGVRYSIENPQKYLETNVNGFFNILDLSKKFNVNHLLYASTSSVYGDSKEFPLKEDNIKNKPLSFYAATNLSNEIMAFSYSNLYKLPATGLRFFTVYGPYGRPDMALYKFAKAINSGREIQLFNNGKHIRDFTYVDDVVNAIKLLLVKPPKGKIPHDIFNVASSKPETLRKYLETIEFHLNKNAKVKKLNLQKGDVYKTHASITKLKLKTGFKPSFEISEGVLNFVNWFKRNLKKR